MQSITETNISFIFYIIQMTTNKSNKPLVRVEYNRTTEEYDYWRKIIITYLTSYQNYIFESKDYWYIEKPSEDCPNWYEEYENICHCLTTDEYVWEDVSDFDDMIRCYVKQIRKN